MEPIIKPICLGELKYRYSVSKNNRRIPARTKGGKPIIDDIIFQEDEDEFIRLKEELKNFITPMWKFQFGELRKSGFEENNEWQHGVV